MLMLARTANGRLEGKAKSLSKHIFKHLFRSNLQKINERFYNMSERDMSYSEKNQVIYKDLRD